MIDSNTIQKINTSKRRLLLLDYDGTLVPLKQFPNQATPSKELEELLSKIILQHQTELIIITGRTRNEIDKFLGHLSIDIIAEHGAVSKQKGNWIDQINDKGLWKDKALDLLNKRTLVCPYSFVEEKNFSVAWHYRNVEGEVGELHAKELTFALQKLTESFKLKIIKGNKVIEVLPSLTDKGISVKRVIESNAYDCIICIGDDKTDEDMFDYLVQNEKAITIKVGAGETSAKYKLEDVNQVIYFLEQILK